MKLFIEGTNEHENNQPKYRKYIVKDKKMKEYYLKSRRAKDCMGNNTCHYAFEIRAKEKK